MAGNRLHRRAFVAEILANRGEALAVTGLGSATWDCAAAGDVAENLYLWGGMGLAVSTALGLALAQPERRVIAVTGDGEMMMGLGALAVVAAEAPANLSILVLDNERFGETGQQDGLTGRKTDLCAIAAGAGIGHTMLVERTEQVAEAARLLFHTPGPAFVLAKIAEGEAPAAHPERDGAAIAARFRDALLR